ncbi:MAG: Ig-like domain-containing protein [Chloroflexota bacterium]|nr:Ig-like domain-containing protein [Chloroflexota bacterium]
MTQLRRHPAIPRGLIVGSALAVAAAISASGAAQAGLATVLPAPPSILPANVGIGIGTHQAVTLTFSHEMDRASVEAALNVTPSHNVRVSWSEDGRKLRVTPLGLWSTDQRYALVVAASARGASGALLGAPATYSFTTETAPRIQEFGVRFVAEQAVDSSILDARVPEEVAPPRDSASEVSAATSISITFSTAMNRGEVERAFLLSPAVPGLFRWEGSTMTFTPIERLGSDARYAASLTGVHDVNGNPLSGDASFSFTTRASAQLVQSTPSAGATRVSDKEVVLWFSQPVDPAAVGAALQVRDRSTGKALTGSLVWNASATQLRFSPARAFAAGHRFDVSLAAGAVDADGNPVEASLTFTTKPAPRPAVSGPAPSATLVGYALNQVNAARAAYGLAPLVYDKAIEAVALAHAWEQVRYNYFGHTGRNGSSHEDRLRAAGLGFGWNGENLCMNNNSSRTTTQTLDWCQAQFMSEPYPGLPNHIGNILGTHYTRVGIGIAVQGGKVIVVWNFIG